MRQPMTESRNVAGMTCIDVMKALSAYADGELDHVATQQIEAHVAGCTWCEQFGAGFIEMLQMMRTGMREAEPVPDDVAARLRVALEPRS